MPKKKKPEGVLVEVEVTLPGRNNSGCLYAGVYVDPEDDAFGDWPALKELTEIVSDKVHDAINVCSFTCELTLKGDNIEIELAEDDGDTIEAVATNEAALESAYEVMAQVINDKLKVKLRNGREALAEIKAARKAKRDAEAQEEEEEEEEEDEEE